MTTRVEWLSCPHRISMDKYLCSLVICQHHSFPHSFSFLHLFSRAQGTSHPFLWHCWATSFFWPLWHVTLLPFSSLLIKLLPYSRGGQNSITEIKRQHTHKNKTMKRPMQSVIGDRSEGAHWERSVGLEWDSCSTSTSAISYLWPLASQSLSLLICKTERTPPHIQWSQQWNHVMTAMGLALLRGNVRKLPALEIAHRHTCHVPNVWCVQ